MGRQLPRIQPQPGCDGGRRIARLRDGDLAIGKGDHATVVRLGAGCCLRRGGGGVQAAIHPAAQIGIEAALGSAGRQGKRRDQKRLRHDKSHSS
ncbi:hypothetical protein MGSAQ_003100 [marine sediment metagenome]|uniref:Uncharacterized protein n=1 Tax=marine sediment metagenome TaxID=412755 RepID=A0A1B6NQ14_9ZZZZ